MPVPSLPLSNEDELNLSSSVVDITKGDVRTANGRNLIRLAGAQIPEQLASVSFSALDVLYQEVTSFCSTNKDCLTALRIYFGASNDSGSAEMKLFFEPLFLAFQSTDSTTGERLYNVTETGNLYSYSGSTFDLETPANLTSAQTLFEGELTLKHTSTSASFNGFVKGTDVESGVIPFQTIFALLNDNGNTEFNIRHCVDLEDKTGIEEVKETIILSAPELSSNGDFAGKYANRTLKNPPFTNLLPFKVV